MKEKHLKAFAKCAVTFADLSYARRLKVGCIIVKDNNIIAIGYNGTPAGWDNNCEYVADIDENGKEVLATKPEVIHAEINATGKLARGTISAEGATAFITHTPCVDCAKSLYSSGIKEVYYLNEYRSLDGINFLQDCGIKVVKLEDNEDDRMS